MLSVILIWFYMAVTTFLLGYGILTVISHFCTYQVRRWDSYFMCGLAAATVYAQFYSLFGGVGFGANLGLLGVCISIAFLCRKQLGKDWQNLCQGHIFCGKGIGIAILILLYAYGTSRGLIHYDTSLYHAQSIRWIEEYGIVKGLGNLHCRLAYNSSSFALSALYSMSFLGGQSYHCAAGFLALLLAGKCLKIGEILGRKKLQTSDFARVMCIYYLLIIFDEMVSPASDYFMVLTAFYIVIEWLDLLEDGEDSIFPYAMLCVMGIYLLTIKLSAALLVLLVVKPAWRLVREKRGKEIFLYLGLGILIALPFLIRNVILSGWLVYPFTFLDVFHVDWKIPEGIAAYDAKEIQVWGRGYSDVTRFDIPLMEWLPDWFASLGGMDKIFVLAGVISVLLAVVRVVWCLIRRKEWSDKLLVEAVVSLCFLFWLGTSPLIRYGCVYVYLASAVVLGDVLTEFLHRENTDGVQKICVAVMGLFLLYKAAAFGKELVVFYVNDYWFCQKDYENYETESYEIEGITFYTPVSGDQTGYESFPSSPTKAKIGLRGEGIEDGFYYAE